MQPEGKKFFLAPSLAVAEGDLAFFPSSQITQEYEKVIIMRCEGLDNLFFSPCMMHRDVCTMVLLRMKS